MKLGEIKIDALMLIFPSIAIETDIDNISPYDFEKPKKAKDLGEYEVDLD